MDRTAAGYRQESVTPSRLSRAFLLSFLFCAFALRWSFPPYPTELFGKAGILIVVLAFAAIIRHVRYVALLGIAATLGVTTAMAVVQFQVHVITPTSIESFADDSKRTLRGIIVGDPDVRPMVSKYIVDVDSLMNADGVWEPADGLVLASDKSGWPEHFYRDAVQISGKLDRPGKIEDFSYDNYLSIRGIYAVMSPATVQTVRPGALPGGFLGWRAVYAGLIGIRQRFELQIQRVYPEPHASFLAGLLTGSRAGIPQNLTDDFRTAGLSHIVAISGYNITIIISLLSGMLFFIPLRWRFPVLVAGISAFTLLVGASASVVRASIMGILGLFAIQMERKSDMRLAILWTAFIMTAWNPPSLWFDAGFQLSFLAIIGLTELSGWLDRILRWMPDTLGIRTSLSATLAAQIGTFPLILLLFKRVSVIAPIANLLVAPLIPLAMLLGFAGTMISFLWFELGQLIGYGGWGLLEIIIIIAHWSARVPYATVGF